MIADRVTNGKAAIFTDGGLPRESDKVKGDEVVWQDSDDANYAIGVVKKGNNYNVSQYVWQGNPVNNQDDAYKKTTVTIDGTDVTADFKLAAKLGIDMIESGSGSVEYVYHSP